MPTGTVVDIMVATLDQLNAAIGHVDGQTTGSYDIQLTGNIMAGTSSKIGLGLTYNGSPVIVNGTVLPGSNEPYALNLAPGVNVTIDGGGNTLNGAGAYRGLFVFSGNVAIQNLTIANAKAKGGTGGYGGGGGGAGLGGGLFVGGTNPGTTGGNVTLTNVTFTGDSAVGGSGGAGGTHDLGAGGGLGGAGYIGGGGVGVSAVGGRTGVNGGDGGDGILPGAASGGGNSKYGIGGDFAGGGGRYGGGGVGGSGGTIPQRGSAGFGGGSPSSSSASGGFGGGGGFGSGGGFGGGGGGGASIFGRGSGSGGFGGGNGGFGYTPAGGGGGGLGAGADVFVQQGGTLTIGAGTSMGVGTVTGGAGGAGVPGGAYGLGGSPGGGGGGYFGSGLFIQGNQTVTLNPGAGKSLTVAGVIADQDGSIAGSGGMGTLVIDSGTVTLSGANTFTGGTYLEGGTAVAGSASAFGSGTIHAVDPTINYATTGTYSNPIELDVGQPAATDPMTFQVDSGVTATITGAITTGIGNNAMNQTIDANQPIVVSGTGTLVLANTEDYSGATTIQSGATLALSGTGSIAGSSGVADAGTFDISAASAGLSIKALTGGTTGRVDLGAHGLTITAASGTFAGVIADGGRGGGVGGSVTLTGGSQTFSGANTYSGGTTISAGTLELDNANAAGGGAITFGSDTTLTISGTTMPTNTLDGFVGGNIIGDTIDLKSIGNVGGSHADMDYSTNVLTVTEGTATYALNFNPTETFAGDYFHLTGASGGTEITENTTPCYCSGTLIRTRGGQNRVEELKIGDKVMTKSGTARPIKWIGRRSFGGRFIMGRTDILPICIKAGALDDNVPRRDLWISPHHAMYLEGVLIEAKDLVNGVSIVQAERVEKVEYFHIELDSHDVIVAEGAPSESFLDDDSRGMFHNAYEYRKLYPEAATSVSQYCAPRLEDGYEVEAARRSIALRTGLWASDDEPRVGSLRGRVDRVSTECIAGWAQNTDHREAPVCLDIYAGGRLIGQTLANRYREDLERAGLGSGRHSFDFTPPHGLDLESLRIEVRRSLDGATLGSANYVVETLALRA